MIHKGAVCKIETVSKIGTDTTKEIGVDRGVYSYVVYA